MSKKKNFVQLSLEHTSFQSSPNWEDIDDDDCGLVLDPNAIARIRGELPNAPRASRYEQLVENISEEGPFRIKISNVPFTCNEEHVENFFYPIIPVQLSLRPNRNAQLGNKHRGFGFVDFNTRKELIAALQLNGKQLSGRTVNIELAEPEPLQFSRDNSTSQYRDKRYGNLGSMEQPASETETNWRRKPPVDHSQSSDFHSEREPHSFDTYRGGSTFQRRGPPSNTSFRSSNADAPENVSNDNDNWRRKQQTPPYIPPERAGPSQFDDFRSGDRGGRGGHFARGGAHFNGSQRSDSSSQQDSVTNVPPGFEAPRERPRIVIDKRTIASTEPVARSSSIFGQAKPVDTLTKDLQIEEKLIAEKEGLKRQLEIQQEVAKHEKEESVKSNPSHHESDLSNQSRPIVVKQRMQSTSTTGDLNEVHEATSNVSSSHATMRGYEQIHPSSQKSSHILPDANRVRNQNVTNGITFEPLPPSTSSTTPLSQVNSWRIQSQAALPQDKSRDTHASYTSSTVIHPTAVFTPHSISSGSQPRSGTVNPVSSSLPPQRNPPNVIKPTEQASHPNQATLPASSFIRPSLSYSQIAKSKLDASSISAMPAQPPSAPIVVSAQSSVQNATLGPRNPSAISNVAVSSNDESNASQSYKNERPFPQSQHGPSFAATTEDSQVDRPYGERYSRGRGSGISRGGKYNENPAIDEYNRPRGRLRGSGMDRPFRSGRGGRVNYDDRNSPQPSVDSYDNRSNSDSNYREGNKKWQPRGGGGTGGRMNSDNWRPTASATSEK